ncbi:MAG: ATP-binding protein [Actinocatenispora sp.]
MDTERELQIEPHHGAARAARRFVEETLSEWGLANRLREVLLVSHELVANALVHARSAVRLRLRRLPDRLLVEVGDRDPRLPRRTPIDNFTSVSGRGIMIVEQLAREWGARPVADGKIVWAEFVCEDRAMGAVTGLAEGAESGPVGGVNGLAAAAG